MVPLSFAGEEWLLTEGRALYWPRERALLVADLHLEKGSFFARHGQLIPPYDSRETLERVALAIRETGARRVITLGDNFHDSAGSTRLEEHAAGMLHALTRTVDWVWITGNHDPEPPADLGGKVSAEWRQGGLTLRHEPQPNCEPGEIAGHLHPKARLIRRGRSVRRSCFVVDRTRMILPSFGAYTGGLNVLDPAYSHLFNGRAFHALMRGKDQVYKIDAQELR